MQPNAAVTRDLFEQHRLCTWDGAVRRPHQRLMGPTKSHLTSGIKCGATVFNTIVSVMAAPTVTYLRCHEQRHTQLRANDTTPLLPTSHSYSPLGCKVGVLALKEAQALA